MPKQRGSYKKYKFDTNYKIPRSTKHYNDQKLAKLCNETESLSEITNIHRPIQDLQEVVQQFINIENNTIEVKASSQDLTQSLGFDKNICSETHNDDDEFVDNLLKVIEESSESSNIDDKTEKIEIACALLATFFSGKMTQHALTLVLKLINIINNIQLPSCFDDITKLILNNDNDKILYKKIWYCSACNKQITIDNRFQRICNFCKERFVCFQSIYFLLINITFM